VTGWRCPSSLVNHHPLDLRCADASRRSTRAGLSAQRRQAWHHGWAQQLKIAAHSVFAEPNTRDAVVGSKRRDHAAEPVSEVAEHRL